MDDIDKDALSDALEEISKYNINKSVGAVYVLKCDHPGKSEVREIADTDRDDPPSKNPIDPLERSEINKGDGQIGNVTRQYEHNGKKYAPYVEIAIRAEELYYVGKTEDMHPIKRVFQHAAKTEAAAQFFKRGFYPIRIEEISLTDNPSDKEKEKADELTCIEFNNDDILDSVDKYAYY